jgi:hypothetical protein
MKPEKETRRKIAQITPGELRLKPSVKYKLSKVDAASAITKLWKISPSTQVPIKTFGPDQGELHYNDGSGSIGKLNEHRGDVDATHESKHWCHLSANVA